MNAADRAMLQLHKDRIRALQGFAVGGLTEVPVAKVRSAHLASTLAGELGIFGVKPHLMSDYLAGKRVDIGTEESVYWRTIRGQVSPADLQTAFELIHKLFTHEVGTPFSSPVSRRSPRRPGPCPPSRLPGTGCV
jgi:hypothetical protein